MIIAEFPYVSDFLKDTICNNGFKLITTENTDAIFKKRKPNLITSEQTVESFKQNPNQKVYSNSENSISWIIQNLPFTDLPRQIELFKNKVRFREFMQNHHPNYFFKEIEFSQLNKIDISSFPKSFVIKPAVGFFSMGVYIVNCHSDWAQIVLDIQSEIEEVKSLYPVEVFNHSTFIAEELIEGEEYAFDAYYKENGEPVVMNIYYHPFLSGNDVSDRVYLTSNEIVMEKLDLFTNWLKQIGKDARLHNFPLHVEARINTKDELLPIEVNPLRFGGFCTTADCTWFSYGINSYEYFFNELEPNWDQIFEMRKNKLYSLIVLNNSTGVEGENISKFDYDKVASKLSKPLEIRSIDYKKLPLFGFIFAELEKDNYSEIEYFLKSDLKEFITEKTEGLRN
jgi:hypothetical protein